MQNSQVKNSKRLPFDVRQSLQVYQIERNCDENDPLTITPTDPEERK